ncbi:universal stress protein [Arthrobacter sp. GMC3]|uniref:universal stress protein n=1 Tax=Arthrobacter sp. GMC3 TaxID=2058894 RepID=UPI000CE40C5B|nr:universal stress protein [Arthrobacter sp. GMC3]
MSRVVVGVSASSGSPGALAAGIEQARWRHAELVAVQAWRPPRPPSSPGGRMPGVTRDVEAEQRAAEEQLKEQVAAAVAQADWATEEVSCELILGAPATILVHAAAGAELLVLDAPRRPVATRSPMLAHRIIYQVSCPVLVLPPVNHSGHTV